MNEPKHWKIEWPAECSLNKLAAMAHGVGYRLVLCPNGTLKARQMENIVVRGEKEEERA